MDGKIKVMDCPHCGQTIFKSDGRGSPKVTGATMRHAIQALGLSATQRGTAAYIGATPRAIQAWANRHRLSGWGAVKEWALHE